MKHKKTVFYSAVIILLLLPPSLFLHGVNAEISYGELVDKITILTIKMNYITNEDKLKNIQKDLNSLQNTYDQHVGHNPEIIKLQKELYIVNKALWEIEDAIRIKEYKEEFDYEFISLARQVYITNDKRAALKKQIDILLNSPITEEKSYEQYIPNT